MHAAERCERVLETDAATVAGMGIEGRDSVRRAREPIVEEAERRRVAARMRMSVWRRKGREVGVVGVPRRVRSWWEKVMKAGRRESLDRCGGFDGFSVGSGWLRRKTPPHWGMIQLVAVFSFTTMGDWDGSGT